MTSVPVLAVDTPELRLHLSVLAAVSRSSQHRGSRRVLLTVDAAGLKGRLDRAATAGEVHDLQRSLEPGRPATTRPSSCRPGRRWWCAGAMTGSKAS